MNRREAMMAWISGITAAIAIAPTADAQASEGPTRIWIRFALC